MKYEALSIVCGAIGLLGFFSAVMSFLATMMRAIGHSGADYSVLVFMASVVIAVVGSKLWLYFDDRAMESQAGSDG